VNILALGGSIHDFSACILSNGEIKVAIEEERLTKKKYAVHDRSTFRCKAAGYCLTTLGLTMNEIDVVVGNDLIESDYYMKYTDQIKLYNHHLTHAASSYYPSPYREAAVLVIDGRGSYINEDKRTRETISFYQAESGELNCISKNIGVETEDFAIVTNSLGMFLQYVTQEIGYSQMDEKKMINHSHGGTSRFVTDFNKFYTMKNEQFLQDFEQLKALKRFMEEELEKTEDYKAKDQIRRDLAFAAQYHLEAIVVQLCDKLYKMTQKPNLCLAGGIFENAKLLQKIRKHTPFKNIFSPSFMGDAGTSIGAALLHYHSTNQPARIWRYNQRLGKNHSNEKSIKHLRQHHEKYRFYNKKEIIKYTAHLLTRGYLIGIFRGKSEFGRYPKGNRNILGDSRKIGLKKKLQMTKNMDVYEPCSILKFDQMGKQESPLLLSRCYLKNPDQFPLVINDDGSTFYISIEKNSSFISKLLGEYEALTSIPFVLNTPLKRSNDTLIETPEEAIEFFCSSDLDALVLDEQIIMKNDIL
jgi:carbamoyltransferase